MSKKKCLQTLHRNEDEKRPTKREESTPPLPQGTQLAPIRGKTLHYPRWQSCFPFSLIHEKKKKNEAQRTDKAGSFLKRETQFTLSWIFWETNIWSQGNVALVGCPKCGSMNLH